MIEVARRLELQASSDDVWQVLSDPTVVVSCLPGASLDGEVVDGSFEGRITVAFGALRVPFRGKGKLELDEAARQGTLTGQGRDSSGGTRFRATADFSVSDGETTGSVVLLNSTVDIQGKLAPLIEAGANSVVEVMLTEFGKALDATAGGAARGAEGAADAAPVTNAPARMSFTMLIRAAMAVFAAMVQRGWRTITRR